MKWNMISMGDIALRKGGSVDPKKHQDEVFELYSIPAFAAGAPEVVCWLCNWLFKEGLSSRTT